MIPFWRKIPESVRIAITIFLVVVPLWFLAAIFKKRFLGNFGEGLLIEAFGMLLDILIIGIVILWLNEKREKRRRIERWQEEIDDFRGWKSEEAMYRIVGNIKRLNREGISRIKLTECFLENADLRYVNLTEANLWGTHLTQAVLFEAILEKAGFENANAEKASFMNANLKEADFCRAILRGTDFRKADMTMTYLRETDLSEADFWGADLSKADLIDADLSRANIWGAVNLTLSQLSNVKTLYQAKLDPELEKQIKEHYRHLLEKPEDE